MLPTEDDGPQFYADTIDPQASPDPPSTPGLPVAAVAPPAMTPPNPPTTPTGPVQSWAIPSPP